MKAKIKLLASAVAAATLAVAGGASAATYVDNWTVAPGGGISVVFGDNGLEIPGAETIPGETTTTHNFNASTGAFTDTFSFELPNGLVGFTLSSIGLLPNSSLTLSSFTFNGTPIPFTNTPSGDGGNTVQSASGALPVVLGGPQVLTVTGTGGGESVFSGTATFRPVGVVPEPGSWALMIIGFGGMGAMLRRSRRMAALA
jgi:hypothetical protein